MSAKETLEQWAARVAPTLTAEQWHTAEREHGRALSSWPLGAQYTLRQHGALLAYRDSVAAGLSSAMRMVLLSLDHNVAVGRDGTVDALVRRGLATGWGYLPTDFGREVVRALRERKEVDRG